MSTIEALIRDAYRSWDDAAALSRLGRELHDRNRLDHARAVLARAVELDPSDEDAWAYLAYARYRALDSEGGASALRRGIEATGSDDLRATLAGFSPPGDAERLREQIAGTADPGARAQLLSSRFWAGEHEAALAGLRALVTEHPESTAVREILAWTLMGARSRDVVEGLDLHQEGIPLAERAIAEHPDRIRGYWMKMTMLRAEKDWKGVLEESARVLERFPDEETAMQFRGQACRETGDEDRALVWFQRAIGAKPSFAGARVDAGRLYEQLGKARIAEETFREIPAANPEYPLGPVSLALFLGRQGRWEEAEPLFLETWAGLGEMWRNSLRQVPQAEAMLAREAVRAVVGESETRPQAAEA